MYISDENQIDDLIAEAVELGISIGDYLISKPCVMKSYAGWYVGEFCVERVDEEFFMPMPYDRLTTYCNNQETAQVWLDALLELEE